MKVATLIASRNRPDLVDSLVGSLRASTAVENEVFVVEYDQPRASAELGYCLWVGPATGDSSRASTVFELRVAAMNGRGSGAVHLCGRRLRLPGRLECLLASLTDHVPAT